MRNINLLVLEAMYTLSNGTQVFSSKPPTQRNPQSIATILTKFPSQRIFDRTNQQSKIPNTTSQIITGNGIPVNNTTGFQNTPTKAVAALNRDNLVLPAGAKYDPSNPSYRPSNGFAGDFYGGANSVRGASNFGRLSGGYNIRF